MVTIVVLLILAGVTIQLVLNDGGIFSQAQKSKEQTRIGELLDKFNVSEATVSLEKLGKPSLEDFINQVQNKEGYIIEAEKQDDGHYQVNTEDGYVFDVSIIEIGDNLIQVLATSGDNHLGGDDFDQKVMDWLAEEFKKTEGIDLKSDKQAMQRLKEAAEKAKCELSSVVETNINLPFITADANGPKHLDMTLSRAKFEELSHDLLERCKKPVEQAIKDAGISKNEIDEVVLVGGSTRIPAVQALVKEYTGKEPNQSVNPDEVVAVGAAVQAGVLAGEVKDIVLLDVTPLTLGIETLGGVMTPLVQRNTTIPVSKSQVFSTADDNQTAVDIHVLQGERPMARDNKSLGMFRLDGIPPAMKGMPQIEVTFDIDANGIVNVTAKDKATNKEQKITITNSSNLSESDIDKIVTWTKWTSKE